MFTDHTSGYKGKYRVPVSILSSQEKECFELTDMDLLVHIGEVSGGYIGLSPHAVWRVNLDGELRDTYRKLTCVFEMEEQAFLNIMRIPLDQLAMLTLIPVGQN